LSAPGRCFNCEEIVDGDCYCPGCGIHVCGSCNIGFPMGPHDADDHLIEPDLDEDDYDDEL